MLGLSSDFRLIDNEYEREFILQAVLDDVPRATRFFEEGDPSYWSFDKYLSYIRGQKLLLASPDNTLEMHPYPLIFREFNRYLKDMGAIDFDDVLYLSYRLLTEHTEVAPLYHNQYQYILVDDAHYLNPTQYRVLRALCSGSFKNLMLAGDSSRKQPYDITVDSLPMRSDFVQDFKPTEYKLLRKYHSARYIVAFANGLELYASTLNFTYRGFRQIQKYADEARETQEIADNIETLLSSGWTGGVNKLPLEQIAVMAGNYSRLEAVSAELAKRGIHFSFKQDAQALMSDSIVFRAFGNVFLIKLDIFGKS